VAHARGPAIRLVVDGQRVSGWLPSRADPPRIETVDVPVTLAPGPHRVRVELEGKGPLLLDYLELREEGGS
jgi:hypothetical protein